MKGPYDGRDTTYFFGAAPRHSTSEVPHYTTPTLARAVRTFRAGTLHLERYADKAGTVPIFVFTRVDKPCTNKPCTKDYVEIARIPVEAVEEDPDVLARAGSLFDSALPPVATTALAPASAATGLRTASRRDMESRSLAVEKRLAEMEKLKAELALQAAALKAELARRMEQIWLIELFLGSHEEVKVLREGTPAPANTLIAVRQAVLCMDEEIAVHDWFQNPDRIGTFGIQNVADFDRWLLERPAALTTLCPWPKGIVGLRVRRKQREREKAGDIVEALTNLQEDMDDQRTYLLIRNGEQLYRIWADVNPWPRLFASEADTATLGPLKEGEDIRASWDRDADKERLKQQVAGLVAVQGMIERSAILHPLPRPDLSVFDPEHEAHFLLVRDGEDRLALPEGADATQHIRWHDTYRQRFRCGTWENDYDGPDHGRISRGYQSWLREQVKTGVRVLFLGTLDRDAKNLQERTGVETLGYGGWPQRGEVFTVTTMGKQYHGDGCFLYLPRDTVRWDEDGNPVPRKKRVAFAFYTDEVIPIDFLSARVLRHLILDRSQRAHYGDFFRLAFDYWRVAEQERAHERPFVDLVLRAEGVHLGDDAERARVERLLRWWKLKTSEHRTLKADEPKALRMIRKAFAAGEDWMDDPEYRLGRRV